ncbi:E3 ubiquitin-protein ligase rnf146 isoform X1 [Drosophila guanche]|uniref:E3 ubiquitin-protein ligase n=2 Tax=Drosophila guanche TaxID=7266 RepID=A0A3B0JSE7_DROGU|nr:E3 ubiquitin-protein ligase rnf146 isoform X1 [Drosophila guanche]SPP76619.1 blast:E3 ubiquitin-protein ligase rnf146 [Drosophila guanche]
MSNQKADKSNAIVIVEDDDEDIEYMGTTTTMQPIVTIDLSGDMPSTSAAAAARDANGIVGAAPLTGASPKATTNGETGPSALDGASSTGAAALECAICLQTCIHPARLPCGHIFCFLCIKGVAYKNRRCAMCRREIPSEFLDHPTLVNGIEDICVTRATEDGYQWYYEGRNGWWQYDDRTSQDIEEAFKKGEKSCSILVAGYVYVVDLEQLVQQRQNEPTRCRRVKRDLANIPKKGVAGLRIEGNQVTSDTVFSRPAPNPPTSNTTAAAAASTFISTIAATDAAIRIASDIIGSTLAHADELTRGLTASNICEDPSSSSSGEQTMSNNPQDSNTTAAPGAGAAAGTTRSLASSPSSSIQDLLFSATEDLLNTQQVIANNQHTIDLFEQALNDFQALTMHTFVDSSDDDEDENEEELNEALVELEPRDVEASETQPNSKLEGL